MNKQKKLLAVACLASMAALAAFGKTKKYDLVIDEDNVIEPGGSVTLTLDDFVEEISGNEVLSEFLPDSVEIEWTGTKFKTPKAGTVKVKKIDGEYEVVVNSKGEDNPSRLSLKYSKKKNKVTGSFKVYTTYETKKGKLKLKKYTAKISGTLGDALTVKIKKVGSFDAYLE